MKRGGCWAAGAAPGGKGEDPLPAAEHEEGYFVHLSKFVVSEERCPLIWTKHKFSGQKKSVEDPINFPSDPDSKWFAGKHADCNSFLDFTNSIFQCSGFGQKSPAYIVIRNTFKLLELFSSQYINKSPTVQHVGEWVARQLEQVLRGPVVVIAGGHGGRGGHTYRINNAWVDWIKPGIGTHQAPQGNSYRKGPECSGSPPWRAQGRQRQQPPRRGCWRWPCCGTSPWLQPEQRTKRIKGR